MDVNEHNMIDFF